MATKKKKKSTTGHQSYSSNIQHTINGNIPYIPPVTGTYKVTTSGGTGTIKMPAGTVVNPDTLINHTSTGKLSFITPNQSNINWNIGVSNGHTQHINVDPNGVWTIHQPSPTYKCNVCKKKKPYFAITYEGYNKNTTRRICKPCYTKKMDKIFGIKGGKVEKLLYENKEDSTK